MGILTNWKRQTTRKRNKAIKDLMGTGYGKIIMILIIIFILFILSTLE